MSVKDKLWALDQLRHKRNATILTLAAMRLLNSPAILSLKDRIVLLRKNEFVFDPTESEKTGRRTEIPFNQIIHSYEQDPSNFNVDMLELYKFARRNLVKESFEVLKDYAREPRLLAKVRLQDWYWFAYHVRNAVSHDLHWDFSGKEGRKRLPLTWGDKTIDPNMENTELEAWFLDPLITFDLMTEIAQFIQDN